MVMLRVLALFDAPIPARRALSALATAGVAAADTWTAPLLPGPPRAQLLAPVTDLAAVRRALLEREVPADLGEIAVDAVRRGAILVLVETPTASANQVAEILTGAGAMDPAVLEALWRAHPGTTYDWAAVPPPIVDPPASLQAPPAAPVGSGDPVQPD
jgi:hypothetical protein